MKRMVLAILLALLALVSLSACGGGQEAPEQRAPEQEVTPPEEEEVGDLEDDYKFDPGELSYLQLSRDELLEIYNGFYDLLKETDTTSFSPEEQSKFEDDCIEKISEKYKLDSDDVNNIVLYGSIPNYFLTFDANKVELEHGELLSLTASGSEIVIKAKITASATNKMTIDKNYYSVCEFIRDYAKTDYTSISYWAVADMSDGSEGKVISFDLPGDLIQLIATQDFPDNTLGDYVDNLYILPSLLK